MSLGRRISAAAARKLPLKRVRSRLQRPLASLTFDDFPASAWRTAGPMLARYGVRATYYTAASFCGRTEDGLAYYDAEDLRATQAAGHEIGCHSFSHAMAPQVGSRELRLEADRNAEALGRWLGEARLSSYAYPYGEVSPRTKWLMARRFASARGIRAGVNSGWIDLAQLRAVPLEARRWRPDEIAAAIDTAKAQNGWLIFFTHDVSDTPTPFGCTPAMLAEVLERTLEAGVAFQPVKHAMAETVFGEG